MDVLGGIKIQNVREMQRSKTLTLHLEFTQTKVDKHS